ncbi:MAG: hypothetical protein ACAH83_01770 [Alphaproteobacteria bacterium]
MSYKFKDFMSDCISGGTNIVAALTPPLLFSERVTRTVGFVAGVTVMPFVTGAYIGYDKFKDNWQLWKRSSVSEAEKSIRATFGQISTKGYKHWGGGIELKLEEAQVYGVYKDGRTYAEADITRMDTHFDREQGAKDMLGNLAQGATSYGRSMSADEERFIVVRKKGELSSTFYQSAKIDDPSKAPAGAIVATHHYYNSGIGHGGVSDEKFYAITPVDAPTAARLKSLGL